MKKHHLLCWTLKNFLPTYIKYVYRKFFRESAAHLALFQQARMSLEGAIISTTLIFLNISVFVFSVLIVGKFWKNRDLLLMRYLFVFMLSFCLVSFFTLNVYISSSVEEKILFSRFRFIGFSLLAPSGLLFFSSALKRWKWLHQPAVWILLFGPALGTILIVGGVLDPEWHVHKHKTFEYWGVSTLTFETGPWFDIYYRWNNIINLLALILLGQAFILDRKKRWQIFLLSFGVFLGSIVDAYCVATSSPFRWLMLSAGTFVITEMSIWYVSYKYDFFELLSAERAERAKILENLSSQRKTIALLAHDLSGNIHQQARLAEFLRRQLDSQQSEVLKTWSDSARASRTHLINTSVRFEFI